MQEALKIAVTGAAGQIGYSLLFRLAAGALGERPVELQLLELPAAQNALKGVAMELEDCAFPLLQKMVLTDNPDVAFSSADVIFLVGARPRGKGMERSDLLKANAAIFIEQGKSIGKNANPAAKILVVGNPANTNAWIAKESAKKVGFQNAQNFHAMMRLDHNRVLGMLAKKLNLRVKDFQKLVVWGNHSPKMFADLRFCTALNQNIADLIADEEWVKNDFATQLGERGAAIIEARGLSSAASAANAAINHMKSWLNGAQDWTTMGIPAPQNSYGIPEGLVFGFPCTVQGGAVSPVLDIELNDYAKSRIAENVAELESERAAVAEMLNPDPTRSRPLFN